MTITKYKSWSLVFLAVLAFFLVLNVAVFKLFTEEMLNNGEYVTPDLVRLGYVVGSTLYRKVENTLPKRHIESWEYTGQRVDVLTIGDSFSNMRMHGRDSMYQDWIATVQNLSVLNVPLIPGLGEFETLTALVNSGYLDKVRPRAVVLECVERHIISKMARTADFAVTRPLVEIEAHYKVPEGKYKLPTVSFINTSNFKFLGFAVLYRFSPNAYFSQVYLKDLSTALFSVPRDTRLLFFNEDLRNMPSTNAQTVRLLNENMNSLAVKLKQKGIAFYFMPAANKLTVYSDYIVNNPYPQSVFFELLREQPKHYNFIDTKMLLLEEVQKGEKDVFYPDDTHWSPKAAKKIAESVKF